LLAALAELDPDEERAIRRRFWQDQSPQRQDAESFASGMQTLTRMLRPMEA